MLAIWIMCGIVAFYGVIFCRWFYARRKHIRQTNQELRDVLVEGELERIMRDYWK